MALTAGLEPSTKYISCYGCRGPMDRRLVEDVVDDDDAANNNGKIMHVVRIRDDDDDDNDSNNNIEKHKKREKYEQLLMGIRNLPPLTYDTTSSKWYVPGLTCPRCHDSTTRAPFERFAQWKEQMEIICCAREGANCILFRIMEKVSTISIHNNESAKMKSSDRTLYYLKKNSLLREFILF